MRPCKHCKKDFEPESLEVFCSVDCTVAGNSQSREAGASGYKGGGFPDGPNAGSYGRDDRLAVASREIDEDEFQEMVCKRATELGWKWFHVRITRQSKAGWFDLVLWRERVLFVELKDETGKATADQLNLADDFRLANAEVYLWRPSQWQEIEDALRRRDV